MEAQLGRALAAGMDVTHLDTHMGAALVPELLDITLCLARRHRLPVLLPRDFGSYLGVLRMGKVDPGPYVIAAEALAAEGMPCFERFLMTSGASSREAAVAYDALLSSAGNGLTFLALHPNAPGDIEAIVADHPRARPEWRTDEYRLLTAGTLDASIGRHGFQRAGMRELRNTWRTGA